MAAKNDDDELENEELEGEEDDEDEDEDGDDDEDDDDDLEQVSKADLLEEIADVLADVYQDATEVDFIEEKEKIHIVMGDGSEWDITARRV